MRPFLAVVLVSLAAGGCDVRVGDNGVSFDVTGNGRARDEWTRTYTLPEGARLEIVNINGRIEAFAAEGRDVQVRAQREARGGSDDEARMLLEKLQMREEVSPTSVRIEADDDETRTGRRNFNIAYEVRIPAGLVVSLKTQNGGIRLENISGQIAVVSANGGLNARAIAGTIDAEVVNGGVEIDLASVTGDINVTSVNGGVELDLPAGLKATLEATCVNGGITVDDRLGPQLSENSRRRVAGTLNGGGTRITTTTVNGGVRIRARGSSENAG